jgi:hypothetical protein
MLKHKLRPIKLIVLGKHYYMQVNIRNNINIQQALTLSIHEQPESSSNQ